MVLPLFFSSRRRHTRSKRDWSSDVCSSDLRENDDAMALLRGDEARQLEAAAPEELMAEARERLVALTVNEAARCLAEGVADGRSEERRGGKECSAGGARECGRASERGGGWW